MVDCDDSQFTSISTDEFGDGKLVTQSMLEAYCKRTMNLDKRVKTLFDMSDPVTSKRFSPPMINADLSYGLVLDSVNKVYKFSDLTSYQFIEQFDSLNHVDTLQTDAIVDTGLKQVSMVPQFNAVEKNIYCEGPWGGYSANAWWYVGYDKDKSFRCTPEWLADPLNCDMPSICRAEVFTAQKTGYLESIVLNLKGDAKAEYDLFFEIRKADATTGAPTGGLIASAKLNHEQIQSPGLMAIPFKFGPLLTSGQKYAIILKSPFTSSDHHYGIGGWGANCKADPCPNADAWSSWDNGHTWMLHGKNDNVPYHEGQYAPQDFAYLVYTRSTTATYSTTVPNWVFLKVYKTNPVKTVYLSADTQVSSENTSVNFYVSNDLKNWFELNESNGFSHTFDTPGIMTYVKAKLSTTNAGMTPIIKGINVHMDTNPATEGYLRGEFYNPKLSMPLGASVWSGVNAPAKLDLNTTCLVDIIRNTEKTDIITIAYSEQNIVQCGRTLQTTDGWGPWNEGVVVYSTTDPAGWNKGCIKITTPGKQSGEGVMVVANVPVNSKIIAGGLEVWVPSGQTIMVQSGFGSMVKYYEGRGCWDSINMEGVPDSSTMYILTAEQGNIEFYVRSCRFGDPFRLSEYPTLPVIDITQNLGDGTYKQLQEGVSAVIDPDTKSVSSYTSLQGFLIIKYYPIWLKGLTQDQFPLKCDLFIEQFTANGVDKTFQLKAVPLDTLRVVTVNDVEMKEYDDYTFDAETKQLVFNTIPAKDAVILVKYTPDLEDTGLAVAYHVTRPDTTKQVAIEANSFEYRT